MTKTTKSGDAIRPGKTYVHELGRRIRLEGEVSPCVFMYPQYPLQVRVTLRRKTRESLGDAYADNRTLTAEAATERDVFRLLSAVRTTPCRRCSAPAFDPATVETNRGGLCESCFVAGLGVEIAEEAETEQRQLTDHDQRMKLKGMKVRVSAWVHPAAGGDDYQADWYFAARPTPAQIRTLLCEEGSSILDDFQIITL